MGGYQQLVRGEPFRGKFRKSLEKPEPSCPGQVETVEFTMPDVFHTFRRGHRIMVQVQSSWFPLVDLNPQTFVDINQAKEADFQKATQRVWRTKDSRRSVTAQRRGELRGRGEDVGGSGIVIVRESRIDPDELKSVSSSSTSRTW